MAAGSGQYDMVTMRRMQISLDERDHELMRKEARILGISLAEFVRRAIRDALPSSGAGAWMRYAGLVQSGDSESSQSIDHLVYGVKD